MVSVVTGLPPGVVLLAEHLQDVAPPEGQRHLSTRDARVLLWVVVQQSPHKQLQKQEIRGGFILDMGGFTSKTFKDN